MNKKQVKKIIEHVERNGGATLTSAGAVTAFERGYIVSLAGFEKRTKKLTKRLLNKYSRIAHKFCVYIGVWLDERGLFCLDLSEHVKTLGAIGATGVIGIPLVY